MPVNDAAAISISRPAFGSPEWDAAVVLRRAVLRTPLGLDYSAIDLASEATDVLFAARHDGRIVGVVMLRRESADGVKLRQMAVAPDMRGRHIGEQLLGAFEDFARHAGVRHIGLAARVTARGFYERNGYLADGEVFIDVTIPHIHMSKAL